MIDQSRLVGSQRETDQKINGKRLTDTLWSEVRASFFNFLYALLACDFQLLFIFTFYLDAECVQFMDRDECISFRDPSVAFIQGVQALALVLGTQLFSLRATVPKQCVVTCSSLLVQSQHWPLPSKLPLAPTPLCTACTAMCPIPLLFVTFSFQRGCPSLPLPSVHCAARLCDSSVRIGSVD